MKKICIYIPEDHLEIVKNALFDAGAGNYKDYDRCCFQLKGEGQFRPKNGATPYIGNINETTVVTEYRVEMIFEDADLTNIIDSIKAAHPYECPAFDIVNILNS